MSQYSIILNFDQDQLTYTDEFLAALWYAAQFNSAPADDREACRAVKGIGREIITRWLAKTPAPLWNRQGTHAKDLPAIGLYARASNVVTASRAVIERHGDNTESIAALAAELKKLDEQKSTQQAYS